MPPATCEHDPAHRASETDVAEALARAEARSVEQGQRWTEPRRRVYELLVRDGGPVKAYDMMEAYAEGRTAKPPTVYRALDFLEQQGLVHRIASLNAYVACGAEAPDHTAAFLICDCCGWVQEFQPGRIQTAALAASARGFAPRTLSLEVRGRCGRCG